MLTHCRSRSTALALLVLLANSAAIHAQDSKPGASSARRHPVQPLGQELGRKKRSALHDSAAEFWIYDDIEAGYAVAKRSGRPLLVSFRCVP